MITYAYERADTCTDEKITYSFDPEAAEINGVLLTFLLTYFQLLIKSGKLVFFISIQHAVNICFFISSRTTLEVNGVT